MPSQPEIAPPPSLFRAWLALVVLSFRRQANARQMVWIALGLLGFAVALVAINTAAQGWGMHRWRWPPPGTRGARVRPVFPVWIDQTQVLTGLAHRGAGSVGVQHAVLGSCRVILQPRVVTPDNRTIAVSGFQVFSQLILFSLFLTFLLPFCNLSFAVEAIGGERESQSLIWLLSRPLPRPAIYLAKFVALLPWTLGLTLGGFALLCLAAGPAGQMALELYWPAVFWATLAFSSLFLLIGAWFRRPAVVAIIYSFCLEMVLGNMPGYLKYASIGFYAKCMMFQSAYAAGVESDKPEAYLSAPRALLVLMLTTALLLGLGMWLFSRKQYHEVD